MDKKTWKLLIVDDDEEDYFIVRTLLSEAKGARCLVEWAPTFQTGRSALQRDGYDAVLVDYDLGILTGLDLIREAVSSQATYPVILLTGRGSYDVDMEAMQSGATMYLTKGEMNSLLLERVIRYAIEMKQKEISLKENEARLQQASERLHLELNERRLAEEKLRESDRWLRLAFDATGLGTWRHDLQRGVYIFDPTAQRHYGFDRPQVSQDETLTHIHPEDLPRLKDEIAMTMDPAGDGRLATTYRVVHPDGKVLHLSVQARVYFKGEGASRRPIMGAGTSQDITEQVQAQAALDQYVERQALLLEISHAILTAQPDPKTLTGIVFEKISAHLNADVSFNYMLETQNGPLRLLEGFGIPPQYWDEAQKLELGQAFCGTVAATRRPLAADAERIQTDPKGKFVRDMGVRAYACHPLFARSGKVMGTLSLASTRRDSFTPDDVKFLQTVCHFIALAWERESTFH